MPPMPYTLEIGRVFSWMTDYLENFGNKKQLLTELRGNSGVAGIAALHSPNNPTVPDTSNPPNMIDPIQHINRDWFGVGGSSWGGQNTGWWTNWHGDAEGITRETIRCAVEIALGVPHHNKTAKAKRNWQMQFLWTCGAPFFQGWVNWQEWNEGDESPPTTDPESVTNGIVTVTFTTPGNGHPLYAEPTRPRGAPTAPDIRPGDADYQDPAWHDPAYLQAEYGLWLIGQAKTEIVFPDRPKFQSNGQKLLPDLDYASLSSSLQQQAQAQLAQIKLGA